MTDQLAKQHIKPNEALYKLTVMQVKLNVLMEPLIALLHLIFYSMWRYN